MAKTRATRAEQGSSILGKDILLFLNYGENASEETPVWALIGGQRSADYNSSAEEIDTTDKTSDGYGDSEPGLKTAELTTEVIVKKGDETISALQEAYEARINFITHVAHEIKTPVTLISAPLDVIRKDEDDPEKLRNIELVQKNTQRLLNLVNQLLDFKKVFVKVGESITVKF